MGLINLQTNLKSLKFGNDRAHGGSSKQPYIQTPIPENSGGFGVLDTDFILRGGSRAVTDSVKDVERLGKYFTDVRNPSGLLFVAKQNLLSRTAVRTQASGLLLNEGIYTPLSTLIEAGGVAFGLHVNKQGLNPFDGPGSLRTYDDVVNPELGEAFSIKNVNKNRLVDLYKEHQTKFNYNEVDICSYPGGPGSSLGIGKTHIKFAGSSASERTGINNPLYKNQKELRNFFLGTAGPGTITSIKLHGNTIEPNILELRKAPYSRNTLSGVYARRDLNKADEDIITSNMLFNTLVDLPKTADLLDSSNKTTFGPSINNEPLTFLTYDQNQIANIPGPNKEGVEYNGQSFHIGRTGITSPGDFRLLLRKKLNNPNSIGQTSGLVPEAPIYTDKNIEQRVRLGDPGNRSGKNLSSYVNGSQQPGIVGKSGGNASSNSYDKINVLPIYKSEKVASDSEQSPVNDLVKFRIGVVDNNIESGKPPLKTYIHFRAFLNGISDGYSSEWNATKYIGRGENLYTYAGFDRKVSLSWTVAAQSKAELIPMYKKLNYLASICAPDYSPVGGYMRGNIVTLTVGGYFYEQPGIITGFSYEMNDDNSTWEIGINDEGKNDSTVKELPHMIKVTGFNFIPIHTFIPSLQENTYNSSNGFNDENVYGAERYIALSNGFDDQNNYGPLPTIPAVNPPPKAEPPVVPPIPKTQDPPPFPLLYPKNTSDLTIRQTQGNRDLVNVQLSKIK